MTVSREARTSAPPLDRGSIFGGRYRIERVLGEGASGVVYLAHDTRVGDRAVALKIIHAELCHDRQIYKRFEREAAILERLDGPHLVKLLDFCREGERLAIALEYVEGTSLDQLVDKRGDGDVGFAVEVVLQVCAALGAAHAAGVVHRDLKPANVIVERPAGRSGLSVRVVDFGLAKVVHGEQMVTGLTEHDMIFGTPEYMAPEQARGDEVDGRCDIYAGGIVLYQLTVGEVPFKARSPLAVMTMHLAEPPPSPRSRRADGAISAALDAVILRALAKEPGDRYPTARAFAEALAAARDDKRVVARSDAPDLGIGDTDLSLGITGLAHEAPPPSVEVVSAPPLRAPTPVSARMPARDAELALAATESTTRPRAAPPWLWLVMVVVVLAVGVGLGTVLGLR